MADDDPAAGVDPTDVGAVADVLYRLAPDRFIAVRTTFVKAARAAGGRDVAREIQGLGRPTKAAWVLNLLARDAPDVVDQLVALGGALAEAQADLDAGTLRELSDQRAGAGAGGVAAGVGIAGEDAPSQALAVEVQDTLTAAVVDPTVGEALRAGALLKAAQASGFGPAGPELASVPPPRALKSVPPPPREKAPASKAVAGKAPAGKAPAGKAPSDAAGKVAEPSAAEKMARAAAEREADKARKAAEKQAAEKRARIAAADAALGSAREGLEAARAAEKEAQEELRIRREQVRDADRALGDAGLAVREARAAVRAAEKARRESVDRPGPRTGRLTGPPAAEVSSGSGRAVPPRRAKCPFREDRHVGGLDPSVTPPQLAMSMFQLRRRGSVLVHRC